MRSVERRRWPVVMAFVLGGAGCVEATQYTPLPPPVPSLRIPNNGSYQGSAFAGALRPEFRWDPVEPANGIGELFYELQYSKDQSFGSGTVSIRTGIPAFQPAESLDIALTPPVGARYYWKVRACFPLICSEYSPAWYVNLGRSEYDLNGDGYADIAVGAPGNQSAQTDAGSVYVYFGGEGLGFDSSPDGVLLGPSLGSRFGSAVASGGDFNGDGFADLLVGAPNESSLGSLAGRVYLYLGGAGVSFNTANDGFISGFFREDQMGLSLSLAGDLNGDGFSDAVMGAPGSDTIGTNVGRAYIYFGRSNAVLEDVLAIDGERVQEGFAKRVEIVSDLNGDGFAELVVDDGPYYTEAGLNECIARIFLGGAGETLGVAKRKKMSSDSDVPCSLMVSDAGDLNADGYGDFVGGYNLSAGRVGFLLGKIGLEPMTRLTTVPVGAYLQVASSGDFNGDGIDDVVLGRIGASLYWGRKGETSFSLPAASGTIASVPIESMSAADLNGDGVDDLAIGAPTDDTSGSDAGRVFIYFGAAGTWDATPDGVLNPGVANSRFGFDLN